MSGDVRYSICICNYNMADTLEQALTSVLDQIDERFEVVVIDDGSADESVSVLAKLSKEYSMLRYKSLERDKKRLLGETRNISIREARGEYVLPQFDCDDVYEVCIKDFVKVFHQIEKCVGIDFYLKGNKLNIGKRSFMLEYGPYRNMFKEDRDMWARMAADDVLIPILHKTIFTRLPKTKSEKNRRALFKTWAHLQADYRSKLNFFHPFLMLFNRKSGRTLKIRVLRCIYSPFAWISARFMSPLPVPEVTAGKRLREYWDEKEGTFGELMRRYRCEPDLSELSESGLSIFGGK